MVTVFGIRHHGPGSAKSLKKALQALQPDCLLVECPADAESMISYVGNTNLQPPVALLIYNPKVLRQAVYYPFAAFSPEWQAFLYAQKEGVPVWCIDLPVGYSFSADHSEHKELKLELTESRSPDDDLLAKDPLGYMAKLAGYTDSERWWESTFESTDNDTAIFDSVLEIMTLLRAEANRPESTETLRREAFMRKTIRKAIKDGYKNIAIVCGAWHAPVLKSVASFTASHDNKLLKGLKKTSVKSTWIPWSYDRLTYLSGYGAGVLSPAWYEMLFSNRKETATRWMVRVARLFRQKDLDATAAHSIEAVRLAESLAAIRGIPIPGIDELKEAAVSTICEGDIQQMTLIEQKLIVGDKVGKVPDDIPQVPLQKDLEKTIKSARLSNYWQRIESLWLKATSTNPRGGIDLREEKDLLKSHLLHRMLLLDIPWGQPQKEGRYDLGSFKEYWKLQWKPDFAIKIVEAGMWGNTVETAAARKVIHRMELISTLPELTKLTSRTLDADLPRAIESLISRMTDLAAVTEDIYHLMDTFPVLVDIVRYGNVRNTDAEAVRKVIDHIFPRICIGLPGSCVQINDELAQQIFDKIIAVHQSVGLFGSPSFGRYWYDALRQIAENDHSHGLLNGGVVKLLFNKDKISLEQTAKTMHFRLSATNDQQESAQWIEGFLYGSGLLLIYNPSLFKIVNDWVASLDPDKFKAIVPLLRRTFAQFSSSEKQRILKMVKQPKISEKNDIFTTEMVSDEFDRIVLPVVNLLLVKD